MTKIRIPIHKHYLIIDSPVGFHLIANNDMDDVYRPAGAWQLDMWSLLTKEYFKQYPVFTLDLEYDETKLNVGEEVVYRESDINLGTGLSGVNGQGVILLGDSVGLAKENTLQSIDTKIDSLATESTLDDIKTILGGLKKKCKKLSYNQFVNYINSISDDSANIVKFPFISLSLKYVVRMEPPSTLIFGNIYVRDNICYRTADGSNTPCFVFDVRYSKSEEKIFIDYLHMSTYQFSTMQVGFGSSYADNIMECYIYDFIE